MATKPGRGAQAETGPWRREIAATTAAFTFLVEDFGASPPKASARQRECTIRWALPHGSVTVFYEGFGPPEVGIRLTSPGPPPRVLADLPLAVIVDDASPGLVRPPDDPAESLERRLERAARLTRDAAADLLRGGTARLPRLKREVADRHRRWNKETFGTSTGETPRFDRRPTLAELFSDATDEGLHSPRAYQALWDYAYPLAEIAAFLGCTEPEVQALLDAWDRLP